MTRVAHAEISDGWVILSHMENWLSSWHDSTDGLEEGHTIGKNLHGWNQKGNLGGPLVGEAIMKEGPMMTYECRTDRGSLPR